MKFFGEKSVSSVMYKLSKVGYALSLVGTIIISIIIIADKVMNNGLYIQRRIISGMFTIELSEGIPNIKNGFILLILLVSLMMLSKFYLKLFNNFRKSIVFDKENVKLIKKIAYIIILGSLFMDLNQYLDYKIAINNINIQGVDINYNILGETFDSIFYVIGNFMIAIALEEAIKYKEENELTI